jgi:hypothetical protein
LAIAPYRPVISFGGIRVVMTPPAGRNCVDIKTPAGRQM